MISIILNVIFEMRVFDETVIDLCPLVNRYEKEYMKKLN